MSTSSRIDSLVTEQFDRWDDDPPQPYYRHNDPTTATATATATAASRLEGPGFDPFSPFQPHPPARQTSSASAAPGWQAGPDGGFYASPEQSPNLRPTTTTTTTAGAEYPLSPLSPAATYSPPQHSRPGALPRRPDSQTHLLRHTSYSQSVSAGSLANELLDYSYFPPPHINSPPPHHPPYQPDSSSHSRLHRVASQHPRDSTYTIVEKPPPVDPDGDAAAAATASSAPAFGGVGGSSSSSGGGGEVGVGHHHHASLGVMRRQESMAHRLGSRLMGTVRRSRTSARWGGSGVRRSVLSSDLEGGSGGGSAGGGVGGLGGGGGGHDSAPYMELRERDRDADDDDAIAVDISTFGPEFAVPQAAARAMEEHGFDDLAYTGTGDAIDLSNLTGFNEERQDPDTFSLHRAGTIENTNKQSFYFSPGRHIPNWKPVVLQTWYLCALIALTAGLIFTVEYLYYLSDKRILRKGPGIAGGGLFSYVNIDDLSVMQFAIWKYLPTLVGVLYGILWKVTDEELKRSEPYYQLSKGATGALAAESLNIEYHNIWSPMVPYAALKYRQLVVAAGGIVSFLASSAVPIFLSVLIRVDPSQKARNHMPDSGAKATKRLVVDAVWTRLLEATLAAIIAFALYIVVTLHRRRSGLQGDPSGIAGVAAMATKSHILMDFHDLDLATEETIHKHLNKRTYILHQGALWQAQMLHESERDHTAPRAMNPHPLLLRVKGMGPFMAFCLIMVVLVPVVVYNRTANVIIDKTPWIITGISILIKSIWELLEKEMRMLEPFWILWNRDAPSSVLTLDYSATIPGFIVLKALVKRHWLLAWVTFVTVLIEVLTVVLGSLDTQGGEESGLSSSVSFDMAIIIFVVVLFTGFLVLLKRRHPFLPRQPGTISSVLAFIHQSKMLIDFDGTAQQTTLERKQKLDRLGKRYGFGWYVGRDGKRHLGIDFEPLIKAYEFGDDPSKAVMDNPVSWERYDTP